MKKVNRFEMSENIMWSLTDCVEKFGAIEVLPAGNSKVPEAQVVRLSASNLDCLIWTGSVDGNLVIYYDEQENNIPVLYCYVKEDDVLWDLVCSLFHKGE